MISITGKGTSPQSQLSGSLVFGTTGHLAVVGESQCTFVLEASDASFIIKEGADPTGLNGLELSTVEFAGASATATKTMEVAGGDGGADNENFTTANFVLGELTVGSANAQNKVTLQFTDSEDNQDDGADNEALYVKDLSIAYRGTFYCSDGLHLDTPVYYKNGGNGKQLIMGDTDLDGTVTFADYQILEANFGYSGKSWANGDFNGDGTVDYDDYLILDANYPQNKAMEGYQPLPDLRDFNEDGVVDLEDMGIAQERYAQEQK